MNKNQKMDIVLKLDECEENMQNVVSELTNLSAEDFPGDVSNFNVAPHIGNGFFNVCEKKMGLIRDLSVTGHKMFQLERDRIIKMVDVNYTETVAYQEEGKSYNQRTLKTDDDGEPKMTYGPTALAAAREDRKDETMCRSLAKYLGFNEDKTEKLIEVTLTMQPLMNSIVNDWGGMSEDEKEVAAKNIAEIYTGMI